MASMYDGPNGTKVIQFTHPKTRKRETWRPGRVIKAKDFHSKLESLLISIRTNTQTEGHVQDWLAGLPDDLANDLAAFGLITPRAVPDTPAETELREDGLAPDSPLAFIDDYSKTRKDVSARTRTNYGQARGFLADFLEYLLNDPKEKPRTIETFTKLDAERFRNWMIGEGHAENYIRTQCKNLKLFFRAAIDGRLIADNPFVKIPCGIVPVPSKLRFVAADDIRAILDVLPNAEWRAMLSLARWGGIRVPSEFQELKLTDIDWGLERITVQVPKLVRFQGKETRTFPLFPELIEPLREVAENAAIGQVYLLPSLRGDKNLRTQFNRYCVQAGVTPWIKPFMNMRSTRETELMEHFPLKVVTEWIGHDPKISLSTYQQVLPEHWKRATEKGGPQRAAKSAAVSAGNVS